MTPDAIPLGPLALPPQVLVAVGAALAGYGAVTLYRKRVPGSDSAVRSLVDRTTTAVLLGFLVWKLFPLVQWTPEILADPVLLLRLPGGRGGAVAGMVVAAAFVAPLFLRNRAILRPALIAVAASILGATIITAALQTAAVSPQYDRAQLFRTEVTILPTGTDGVDTLSQPLMQANRPLVLTFWATWCGPCYAELPVKKAAYEESKASVQFLSVNMTNTEASVAEVRRYVTENTLDYPVALDQHGRLASLFAVRGTPTTVVLASDGTVVSRWMGPSDLGRIRRAIAQASAPAAAGPGQ